MGNNGAAIGPLLSFGGPAMLLSADTDILVLIDFQTKLMPAIAKGERVLNRAQLLAEAAQACGVPVWATEQYPQGLGETVPALLPLIARRLTKTHFNAAAETQVQDALTLWQGRRIVLAGCEAHVCLLQTTLGLHAQGWPVAIVFDACGSRHADDKALARDRLIQAGLPLISAEMAAFEWAEHRGSAAFKPVLAAVKRADAHPL